MSGAGKCRLCVNEKCCVVAGNCFGEGMFCAANAACEELVALVSNVFDDVKAVCVFAIQTDTVDSKRRALDDSHCVVDFNAFCWTVLTIVRDCDVCHACFVACECKGL